MTKYIAQFSNGDTLTRNSEREYSHAYRLTSPTGGHWGQGFSARYDLAEKAARSLGPRRYNRRDLNLAHMASYYKKQAKKEGFESVKAMFAANDAYVDQWWKDAKVEIVEVMWS